MKMIILARDSFDPKATLGKISYYGDPLCESVELPWLQNKQRVSCVIPGVYPIVFLPSGSPKFHYPCFLIKNVPNRAGIMIHRANRASQLLGCIAPGMTRIGLEVANSTAALNQIVQLYLREKFTHIQIINP
jgi:hypothetical protein